jgi:chitinase
MVSRTLLSRRAFLGTLAGSETTTAIERTGIAPAQFGRPDGDRPLVVGYYSSRDGYPPGNVPFEKLTDVVYHALEPKADGTIVADEEATASHLETFSEYSDAHPDTRLHASIGHHDTIDEQAFSDAVATQKRRDNFAETAADLVREYDLDGIDIDWEPQAGDGWSNEKARNYLWLLLACRGRLDRLGDGNQYYLTIAVTDGFANQLRQVRERNPLLTRYADLTNVVDRFHVMTYDYHGPWRDPPKGSDAPRTGFNAPLYTPSDTDVANDSSVADTMENWADELQAWSGLRTDPRDLLTTGLPFYGRRYELVSDASEEETTGLGERFDPDTALSYSYSDIATRFLTDPDYERHWHDEAEVPWLYSAEEDAFISYDDPESIGRKVDYALDNGFAGVVIWEVTQDYEEQLLDAVIARSETDGQASTGEWSMAGGGPTRANATAASGPAPPLTIKWEFEPYVTASPPVVADGTVYVGTRDSGVYAIDSEDGTTREHWPFTEPAGVTVTPAVTDDTVYAVDTEYGHVYAIDRETAAVPDEWNFTVELPNPTYRTVPIVDGDTVYFSSGTNVFGIDARTGTLRDGWPCEAPTKTVGSPAVTDETVYAGTTDSVYAIDATTGTVRDGWPFTRRGLSFPPTVANDTVYVLGYEDEVTGDVLYALDAERGTVRDGWPFTTPGASSFSHVAVGNDAVYVAGKQLYAVNPRTGTTRDEWAFDVEFPKSQFDGIGTQPVVAGNTVYFVVGRGYLYGADAVTGSVTNDWPFRITTHWTFEPVVTDQTIYTVAVEGPPMAIVTEPDR